MKRGVTWKTFELSNETVEEISQMIGDYMVGLKSDKREIIRVRFTVEEMLLRIIDKNEEKMSVEIGLGKRLRRHMLYIRYRGGELDPTKNEEDDEWSTSILEGLGLSPTWTYKGKINQISLILKQPGKINILVSIFIAVLLAIGVGLAGNLMSGNLKSDLDEAIFSPMMSAFLGLLNTFAGFMIAFTISSGILGLGGSRLVGQIGKKIFIRYIILSVIVAIFAVVIAFPLFSFDFSFGAGGMESQLKSISAMLFDILPKDSITPFVIGNTIQVIVISILASVALILLDDKVLKIKALVEEGASLFQRLTTMICSSLLPVFVFSALVHQIWTGNAKVFIGLWKPLVVSLGVSVVFTIISLLGVAVKHRVSPILLMKKFLPAFITAITTASSISAFSKSMDALGEKCGVEKKFLNFSYPIGSVVYMPATVGELCVLSYAMAEMYDIKVSFAWIILAVLTAVLLAIAAPPLPGAATMIYVILFAQLGIPKEAVLLAATLDIIIDYIDTGFNVLLLLVETIDGAGRVGKLDEEKLAS